MVMEEVHPSKKRPPPKEDLEPQMVGQYSRVVRKYGNVGWGVGK